LRTVSKRVGRLDRELALLKKLGLEGLSARKETVSFRGMAKLLVPEEELDRSLEDAKRSVFKREL